MNIIKNSSGFEIHPETSKEQEVLENASRTSCSLVFSLSSFVQATHSHLSHQTPSTEKEILVYIEWLDSFGCSPVWTEIGDCQPQPLVCKSVGWMFHDGDEYKVIIPHVTGEGHNQTLRQGCGDMAIPTKAIVKIVPLALPDTIFCSSCSPPELRPNLPRS